MASIDGLRIDFSNGFGADLSKRSVLEELVKDLQNGIEPYLYDDTVVISHMYGGERVILPKEAKQRVKDYGTNNLKAFNDQCPALTTGLHVWNKVQTIGRCCNEFHCIYCKATHVVDSSD